MRRRDVFSLFAAPALLRSQNLRPQMAQGAAIGDVVPGRALVWSRADRPSQMIVEYATNEAFTNAKRIRGPQALAATDFTARLDLAGLPPDQQFFCRVQFESLSDAKALSEPVVARFRTPPASRRDVKFVWSGDTAGQGWGIDVDRGGMRGYEAMRVRHPDFFLHSGDTIYADNPIPREIKLADGGVWRNLTTEATSKPAETLDEFRGNYLYNLMDENVRRFNAEVPQIWQWDDHEVMNNWSPGKDLTKSELYREKQIRTLVSRGRQAFLEYAPIRTWNSSAARIYRRIPYGPLLEVFVVDMRSNRAANTYNRQTSWSSETAYMGRPQLQWLERGLAESKALWKVVAADMPISLQVGDGRDAQGRPVFENSANGDGPPLGREFEIAALLSGLKRRRVRNVVWLTADTHYTAAHHFRPDRAQFTDFDPFWEFVSGPIHSGTFGPAAADNTFGMEVVYQKHPPKGQGNLPPSAGLQFFGEVSIEGRSGGMTVRLMDIGGAVLFEKLLAPGR